MHTSVCKCIETSCYAILYKYNATKWRDAAGKDCVGGGGQLLDQVMWTQISVWRETSLSPVVPPKAMGELPDQPEPDQL